MSVVLAVIFAGLVGAALGSFFNVVIFRLPAGQSLVSPGSQCPSCKTPIRPYDNIPIISWLLLRGRCRSCHSAISARYPLVELLTAGLLALCVALQFHNQALWLNLALIALLIPVAFIDIDHKIIPNSVMAIGAVIGLGLLLGTEIDHSVRHIVAAVSAGGFLLIVALLRPGGMGMGDVKLAAVMGLFLGLSVIPALLIAFVSGSLVGVAIILKRGHKLGAKTAIAFGPFLAFGAIVACFAGPALIHVYRHIAHLS